MTGKNGMNEKNRKKLANTTSLHISIYNNFPIFPQNNARLDCLDSYQQTPLHKAATYNQPEAIATLLEAGAKIERRDK